MAERRRSIQSPTTLRARPAITRTPPRSSTGLRVSPNRKRTGDHADDRYDERERRDGRRRILRQEPRPQGKADLRIDQADRRAGPRDFVESRLTNSQGKVGILP